MTSNTFDFNRFCRVVYRDLTRVWPTMGTTLLVLVLIPFALWLMGAVFGFTVPGGIRWGLILLLPLLVCVMTPSRLYRTANLRGEGIHFAMLPASKLEKWLSMLLYTLVVLPLASLLAALVLDSVLTLIPSWAFDGFVWQADWISPFADVFDGGISSGLLTLLVFLEAAGYALLFMMTNTIFRKHKVLQTLLWVYLVHFVLSLVGIPLLSMFDYEGLSDYLSTWFENHDEEHIVVVLNRLLALYCGVHALWCALLGWIGWRRLDRMQY